MKSHRWHGVVRPPWSRPSRHQYPHPSSSCLLMPFLGSRPFPNTFTTTTRWRLSPLFRCAHHMLLFFFPMSSNNSRPACSDRNSHTTSASGQFSGLELLSGRWPLTLGRCVHADLQHHSQSTSSSSVHVRLGFLNKHLPHLATEAPRTVSSGNPEGWL